MLRGVNRRIIEINDCQSAYFERAIFILRADAAENSEARLKSEASKLIDGIGRPPRQKRRRHLVSRGVLWLITAISSCSAVALLIFALL